MISLEDKKVEIKYPCLWRYKVIIQKEKNIKNIINRYISKEYNLKSSKQSKTGTYKSFNLELMVQNEEERTYFYEELKKDREVKMIL